VVAGRLADRAGHNTSLRLSNVAAGCVIAISAAVEFSVPSHALACILGASVLLGCCDALRISSMQALVSDVTPPGRLTNGLAAMNLVTQLTTLFGSVVGGVLLGPLGFSISLLLAALCHFGAAICNVVAPSEALRPDVATEKPEGKLSLSVVWRDEHLPGIVALIVFAEIFLFSTVALLPSFVHRALHAGPFGLGLLLGGEALGGAVVLVIMTLIVTPRARTTAVACIALGGVALVAQSAAPSIVTVLPVLIVFGAVLSALDTTTQSLLQKSVGVNVRGAAAGVWVAAVGVTPLGQLGLGLFASLVGIRQALAAFGIVDLIGASVAKAGTSRVVR
jgi:hypothetical protein